MQWQQSIVILGVFSDNTSQNGYIFFRNQLGIVGWRRIVPSIPDGVSNIITLAAAAQTSGRHVQLLITNAGEIVAISTL
jgi:hypothetical protein